MNRFFLCIAVMFAFIACNEADKKTSTVATLFDSSYMPATFSDTGRMEKIKKAFAVTDSIYKKYAADNHFPAISFGIVVDGQLVYKNSYGYTDIEKKTLATSASLFRIASMSKSFTCMALLKLRDEGKLNLDDPAWLYIPELKNIKYPTADAPHILSATCISL